MIVKYELWMFELWAGVPWERWTGVSARPSPAIHSPKQGCWKDTVDADDDDDDDDDGI